MRIAFIRHGESEMNALHKVRNVFNGQAETPLTALGRSQAEEVGRVLAQRDDIRFTLAVSSTIQRSVDTAKIILNKLPYSVPLHYSDGLRERSLGIFENRFADEVYKDYPQYRDDPDFKYFRAHFSQKAPDGENLTEVTRRAWAALQAFEMQTDGDMAVFSHATTIRCLMGKALGLSETEIPKLEVPNAVPILLKKHPNGYEWE